jgi:hypothetical protein
LQQGCAAVVEHFLDQNSVWAFACSVCEDPSHHKHSVKRFGQVLQTIHAALDQWADRAARPEDNSEPADAAHRK